MLAACDVKTLLESGLFHDCIVRDVRMPRSGRALSLMLAWVRGWDDDGVAAYEGGMDAHRLHRRDFRLKFDKVQSLSIDWRAEPWCSDPMRPRKVFFSDAAVAEVGEMTGSSDSSNTSRALEAELKWSSGGVVRLRFESLEVSTSDLEAAKEWANHPLFGSLIALSLELGGGER